MTLQNLKYMLEISNSHSFSKAAKNLFVSQSTLSTVINKENSATHDTKKLANVLFDLINALRTDLSPELLHYYLKRYTFNHR